MEYTYTVCNITTINRPQRKVSHILFGNYFFWLTLNQFQFGGLIYLIMNGGNGTQPQSRDDHRLPLTPNNEPIGIEQEQNDLNHDNQEEHNEDDENDEDDEEFYTPGSTELLDARKLILKSSVTRATQRIEQQTESAKTYNSAQTLRHRHAISEYVDLLQLDASYTLKGNTRALSTGRFNKDGSRVACASWDGSFYIMRKESSMFVQESRLYAGFHAEKTVVDWSPLEINILVSGGGEGNVNIWNVDSGEVLKPLETVKNAHSGRIATIAFHPSGNYYATTSYDQTWKFWDIQRPEIELLEQEGHSKEVHAAAFHPDGSLLATGGLDSIGRVWDLRSGRSIAILSKHAKGIYSMDWSPNGYHLASASGDNSIQIWDLRKMHDHDLFTIPAHTKLVSSVRFLQATNSHVITRPVSDEHEENERLLDVSGTLLVSSSFDGTVKVWSADNFVCLKTLKGHNDKVMSCDVSSDGSMIISTGWDRTLKTWYPM